MKLKRIIKISLITIVSFILVTVATFMIGSDFGRRPLFFVNVQTVEKVVKYNLPVTEKTKYETPDFYEQVMAIQRYNDSDFTLKAKDYKTYKSAHIYEFHLKPFGKVKVLSEFGFTEDKQPVSGGTFAVIGPFVFQLVL